MNVQFICPVHRRRNGYLIAIAIFRLVKAMFLIAAAFGALRLLRPAVAHRVAAWIASLPFAGEHDVVRRVLAFVTHLSPQRAGLIAAGLLAYAALFIVEGVGLLMQRTWAEWLTFVATLSFIPFEIVEVVKRPTPVRWVVIAVNVAIAAYLLARRLRKRKRPAISGIAGPFSIR
jgi:uncharacterized membrane protein (DUF2068 family)